MLMISTSLAPLAKVMHTSIQVSAANCSTYANGLRPSKHASVGTGILPAGEAPRIVPICEVFTPRLF